MKKFIAFIAVAMALVIGISVIAIAETAENAEIVETEIVEATETEAVATAESTPEPHIHTWSDNGRVCTGCGEAHPCWNDEEKTFVHDFTDSETCLVCETALYCGAEGHDKNEEHALSACGVPGHFVCDGHAHDEIYGNGFDPEAHTACLEQVGHTCEGCGKTYTCEYSNSHVPCIVCGELWCNKTNGNHTTTPCGHRYCEIYGHSKAYAKCEGCGQYLCNGKNHTSCAVKKTTVAPTVKPTVEPDPTPTPTPIPTDDRGSY